MIVDRELTEWEENTKYGRIRKWFYVDEAKKELEVHKPVQSTYLNLLRGGQTSDLGQLLAGAVKRRPSSNHIVNTVNTHPNGDCCNPDESGGNQQDDNNNNNNEKIVSSLIRISDMQNMSRKNSASSSPSSATARNDSSLASRTSVRF